MYHSNLARLLTFDFARLTRCSFVVIKQYNTMSQRCRVGGLCAMAARTPFYKICFQLGKRRGHLSRQTWLSEQIPEPRSYSGIIATAANPFLILSSLLIRQTPALGGLHAQPGRLHKEAGNWPADWHTIPLPPASDSRLSVDNTLPADWCLPETWGTAPKYRGRHLSQARHAHLPAGWRLASSVPGSWLCSKCIQIRRLLR